MPRPRRVSASVAPTAPAKTRKVQEVKLSFPEVGPETGSHQIRARNRVLRAGGLNASERAKLLNVVSFLREEEAIDIVSESSRKELIGLLQTIQDGLGRFRGIKSGRPRAEVVEFMNRYPLIEDTEEKLKERGRHDAGNLRYLLTKARSTGFCPLTHLQRGLEAAHVVPFPLGSMKTRNGSTAWWCMAFLFGTQFVNDVWTVVSERDNARNRFLLSGWWHGRWEAFEFLLVPQPEISKEFIDLEIQFLDQSARWPWTNCPVRPEDQNPSEWGPARPVGEKDIFRLPTANPKTHPLPDSALLKLREEITALAVLIGVVEFQPENSLKRTFSDMNTSGDLDGEEDDEDEGTDSDEEEGESGDNSGDMIEKRQRCVEGGGDEEDGYEEVDVEFEVLGASDGKDFGLSDTHGGEPQSEESAHEGLAGQENGSRRITILEIRESRGWRYPVE